MKFVRYYTKDGDTPLADLNLTSVYDEEGREYFVPASWGELASEVILQKAFFKGKILAKTGEGFTYESDFGQVLNRICGSITHNLAKDGVFDSDEDKKVFNDELLYIFAKRIAVLDLEIISKIGINWAYGAIEEEPIFEAVGSFDVNQNNAFKRLKIYAEDIAINEAKKESVTIPIENKYADDFINWKQIEEIDAASLNNGKKIVENAMDTIIEACNRDSIFGFDPARNKKLAQVVDAARNSGIGDEFINLALRYAEQGYESVNLNRNIDSDLISDNIAMSVSVSDEFIEAALTDYSFKDNEGSHLSAADRFDNIASAIWSSGEPALIFKDTTANTCPVNKDLFSSVNGGLLFVKGSSAPKAAINLTKFFDNGEVAVDPICHTVRLLTVSMDSLVKDNDYRAINIGFTNLAEFLMSNAIPYDSEKGRCLAALVSALISGSAYKTSCELAEKLGSFAKYAECERRYLKLFKDKIDLLDSNKKINFSLLNDTLLYKKSSELFRKTYELIQKHSIRNAFLTSVGIDNDMQTILGGSSSNISPLYSLLISEDRGFISNKVNDCLLKALATLNYDEIEIEDICMSLLNGDDIAQSINIKEEHIGIFNTLLGVKKVGLLAQIKMQAAVECFLSGSAVNILEMSHHSNIDEIKEFIVSAWNLRVKRLRIYRDRCSLLAPAIVDSFGKNYTADNTHTVEQVAVSETKETINNA